LVPRKNLVICNLRTSSYFAISSSTGAEAGAGAGVATRTGTGAGANVGATAGVGAAFLVDSSGAATCFDGVPGFGGSDGCSGELLDKGFGAGILLVLASGREVEESGLDGAGSEITMTGVLGVGAGLADAIAAALDCAIFSSLCRFILIFMSSSLIFLT